MEAAPPTSPGCELGESRTLESLDAPLPLLGVAFAGNHGLVVHPSASSSLVTIATDPHGNGSAPKSLPFPNAPGLLLVASVGIDFVVVTDGPCADARMLCLSVGLFDATGALKSPVLEIPGHPRISRIRRHTTDSELLLAFSTPEGAPWVDAFTVSDGRLTHMRTTLGRIPNDEKEDDVLAVTGTARDLAVLHRIGSAEDPDGRLVLETARRATAIDALEEAAMIERFVRIGSEYAIVASFEFDRPLVVHVRPDGSLVGTPTRLTRETPLEASLGARESAVLRDEGTHLDLILRDVGGDVLARTEVATRTDGHSLASSVARTELGFLVPFVAADHEGVTLRARTVDCSAQGSR